MHDSMRRKVARFLLNTFECFTQEDWKHFVCLHSFLDVFFWREKPWIRPCFWFSFHSKLFGIAFHYVSSQSDLCRCLVLQQPPSRDVPCAWSTKSSLDTPFHDGFVLRGDFTVISFGAGSCDLCSIYLHCGNPLQLRHSQCEDILGRVCRIYILY